VTELERRVLALVSERLTGMAFGDVWRELEDPPPSGAVWEALRSLERRGEVLRTRDEASGLWLYTPTRWDPSGALRNLDSRTGET
jgi:hypothetical protein